MAVLKNAEGDELFVDCMCGCGDSIYVQDDSLKAPAWFTGGDRGEIFG